MLQTTAAMEDPRLRQYLDFLDGKTADSGFIRSLEHPPTLPSRGRGRRRRHVPLDSGPRRIPLDAGRDMLESGPMVTTSTSKAVDIAPLKFLSPRGRTKFDSYLSSDSGSSRAPNRSHTDPQLPLLVLPPPMPRPPLMPRANSNTDSLNGKAAHTQARLDNEHFKIPRLLHRSGRKPMNKEYVNPNISIWDKIMDGLSDTIHKPAAPPRVRVYPATSRVAPRKVVDREAAVGQSIVETSVNEIVVMKPQEAQTARPLGLTSGEGRRVEEQRQRTLLRVTVKISCNRSEVPNLVKRDHVDSLRMVRDLITDIGRALSLNRFHAQDYVGVEDLTVASGEKSGFIVTLVFKPGSDAASPRELVTSLEACFADENDPIFKGVVTKNLDIKFGVRKVSKNTLRASVIRLRLISSLRDAIQHDSLSMPPVGRGGLLQRLRDGVERNASERTTTRSSLSTADYGRLEDYYEEIENELEVVWPRQASIADEPIPIPHVSKGENSAQYRWDVLAHTDTGKRVERHGDERERLQQKLYSQSISETLLTVDVYADQAKRSLRQGALETRKHISNVVQTLATIERSAHEQALAERSRRRGKDEDLVLLWEQKMLEEVHLRELLERMNRSHVTHARARKEGEAQGGAVEQVGSQPSIESMKLTPEVAEELLVEQKDEEDEEEKDGDGADDEKDDFKWERIRKKAQSGLLYLNVIRALDLKKLPKGVENRRLSISLQFKSSNLHSTVHYTPLFCDARRPVIDLQYIFKVQNASLQHVTVGLQLPSRSQIALEQAAEAERTRTGQPSNELLRRIRIADSKAPSQGKVQILLRDIREQPEGRWEGLWKMDQQQGLHLSAVLIPLTKDTRRHFFDGNGTPLPLEQVMSDVIPKMKLQCPDQNPSHSPTITPDAAYRGRRSPAQGIVGVTDAGVLPSIRRESEEMEPVQAPLQMQHEFADFFEGDEEHWLPLLSSRVKNEEEQAAQLATLPSYYEVGLDISDERQSDSDEELWEDRTFEADPPTAGTNSFEALSSRVEKVDKVRTVRVKKEKITVESVREQLEFSRHMTRIKSKLNHSDAMGNLQGWAARNHADSEATTITSAGGSLPTSAGFPGFAETAEDALFASSN